MVQFGSFMKIVEYFPAPRFFQDRACVLLGVLDAVSDIGPDVKKEFRQAVVKTCCTATGYDSPRIQMPAACENVLLDAAAKHDFLPHREALTPLRDAIRAAEELLRDDTLAFESWVTREFETRRARLDLVTSALASQYFHVFVTGVEDLLRRRCGRLRRNRVKGVIMLRDIVEQSETRLRRCTDQVVSGADMSALRQTSMWMLLHRSLMKYGCFQYRQATLILEGAAQAAQKHIIRDLVCAQCPTVFVRLRAYQVFRDTLLDTLTKWLIPAALAA